MNGSLHYTYGKLYTDMSCLPNTVALTDNRKFILPDSKIYFEHVTPVYTNQFLIKKDLVDRKGDKEEEKDNDNDNAKLWQRWRANEHTFIENPPPSNEVAPIRQCKSCGK